MPRIDGQLVDQAEDARVFDEGVIHRREVNQADFAWFPVVAVHDVRDNFLEDHLIKREEEIKPVAIVELCRDIPRVIVDERDDVFEAKPRNIVFRDIIRLPLELHAIDVLESVVEERDERAALAAAEVADTVPPPVDRCGSDQAWGRFLFAC